MRPSWKTFPFDLLRDPGLPGRTGGLIQQLQPLTMVPPFPWGQWAYSDVFLERCAGLEGDVLEAGVGLGGTSILFGQLIKGAALPKQVLSVDSFQGLPAPNPSKDNPYFSEGEYGAEDGSDRSLMDFWIATARFGVADTVLAVPGFFEDVLPDLDPARRFCFVHVDADLYDSVRCVLEHVWDRLEPGGVVAIDDFFHPAQGPARAASEFFAGRGLAPIYHVTFPYGVLVFNDDPLAKPVRSVRSHDGNSYSLALLRQDGVFLRALEESLERSAGDERAAANCSLLLELLRAPPSSADIYGYWRALEQFWEWADVLPGERILHRH